MGDGADDAFDRGLNEYLDGDFDEGEDGDYGDYYSIRKIRMKPVTITVMHIIAQTEKAWLCAIKNQDYNICELWFPKSQCTLNEGWTKLTLPNWLYRKKCEEFENSEEFF